MRFSLSIRLALLSPCLLGSGPAQQPLAEAPDPAKIATLRETIGQWVETERLIAEEAAQWEMRSASMKQLLELYRQELALLTEELNQAGQSAASFDEKKSRLEKESAALRDARAELAAALGKARHQLLELAERFPAPLRDEAAPELSQLAEWKSGGDVRAGLQSLLNVLDRANRFAGRVTRSREVREGREVEVVYLGLACAYYLSQDGGAGIGTLTPGGWRWEERKELHPKVANVLAQMDESPPALVRLPVPARQSGVQP